MQTQKAAKPAQTQPKKQFHDPVQPAREPLLQTSSNASSFRVSPSLKVVFAILFVMAEPLAAWTLPLLPDALQLPYFALIGVFCLGLGYLCGRVAGALGYSPLFTAGSAGFWAGLIKLAMSFAIQKGATAAILTTAMPIYGIYCLAGFAGGAAALAQIWVGRGGLRTLPRLSPKAVRETIAEETGFVIYNGKRVPIQEAVELLKAPKSAPREDPGTIEIPREALQQARLEREPKLSDHVAKDRKDAAGNGAVLMDQPVSFEFFLEDSKLIRAEGKLIYQVARNGQTQVGVRFTQVEGQEVEGLLVMLIRRLQGEARP